MSGFWLLFSYKFLFKKQAPISTMLLIMTLPVLTLFFSVTNEYHHLIYTNISSVEYDGYLLSQLKRGPWYYVNVLYAYSVQIFGIIVFFQRLEVKGLSNQNTGFLDVVWFNLARIG